MVKNIVLITPRSFARLDNRPLIYLQEAGCLIERNKKQTPYSEEEMVEAISGIDALIVGLDPVTEKVLAAAPRLKVVSKYGAGLDNIDLDAATHYGVVVTNTPGANTEAVADLTYGLMLAVGRRIIEAHESVRAGSWESFLGVDLWGKTLGIIGTGRIGRAVAFRARGFNMKVLSYDCSPDHNWAEGCGASCSSLEDLMRQSDYVTVHLPLTEETRGLIGSDLLRLMKPSAILVNTSRGGIVDETALVEILKQGNIFGAALDVYCIEPLENKDILSSPRLITTPHISAHSSDSLFEMGMMAADNLVRVLQNQRPKHVANPAVYKTNKEGDSDATK